MSKVSISGDVNGTGNFTIKAPNSNVDRTLTIPDSDGEFLFTDSNGDFTVDGDTFYVGSANNRIGVGTTSPSNQLHVLNGSATATVAKFAATNYGNLGITYIEIGTEFGDGGSRIGSLNPTGNKSEIVFETMTATSGVYAERARIDSSGHLLVGTTDSFVVTTSDQIGVAIREEGNLTASRSSNEAINANRINSDGDAIILRKNGSVVGSISVTSSSTSYNTSSDYRLKENVTDLLDGIARLKNLPVHQFNFIAEPDKTVDGFLAHEVQPYVPEAISGEKDEVEAIGNITDSDGEIIEEGVTEPTELKEGQTWTQTGEQPVYQGIDQAKLVPLLTAALQEAVGKIEQQQTQIDDLLSRVDALETKQ